MYGINGLHGFSSEDFIMCGLYGSILLLITFAYRENRLHRLYKIVQ